MQITSLFKEYKNCLLTKILLYDSRKIVHLDSLHGFKKITLVIIKLPNFAYCM